VRLSAERRRQAEVDAHLLVSVGLHLNAEAVPSPLRIALPDPAIRRHELEILVASADLPAWLDSVAVLEQWSTSMRLVFGRPWSMHHVRCRLPASGAIVTVYAVDPPQTAGRVNSKTVP
jgi:hypothetical protein